MRQPSFDIMKGIGIIAMIVGHITVTGISRYIYLWHMPLFFLISGYFFREKEMKECVKSNAKALLIPYLIAATLLALFTSALALTGHDVNAKNAILGIFVGAESIQDSIFSDYQVGAIWFLLALFWCRVTYNFLINRYSGGVILTISVIATYLGSKMFIPTDLLQGLSVMVFFIIGHEAKKRELLSMRLTPVVCVLGLAAITASASTGFPISMATCDYAYYPINVLGAVFATYFIYLLSCRLTMCKGSSILAFLGRISLLILCVHLLDVKLGFASAVSKRLLTDSALVDCFNLCWHIVVPLVIATALSSLTLVRKIFQLK